MKTISVIIPCYYNELNIGPTTDRLLEVEKKLPSGVSFEFVLVDDGSKDNTYEKLVDFRQKYPDKVKIIKLAKNVGSYTAIMAGMNYAEGDCCTVISADLQDPPELILEMYSYWEKGIKLVLATRQNRKDPFITRISAGIFYFFIRKMALKNMPKGGFDFILFDQELNQEVLKIKEKNTNTLYLFPWLGYDYVCIPYERQKRTIGKSRWTFSKKIKLFIDSFVSFSFTPIRIITFLGLFFGLLAIIYGCYILYCKLTGEITLEGWSSMMLVFLFVSSFQMIGLGILGEYVWRTFEASRNRPSYIIEEYKDKSKK